jgi:hypothetical protein
VVFMIVILCSVELVTNVLKGHSFETLVTTYKTVRHYNPEDHI